jgi:membrane protease YdiL (CAAX protease family)
MWAGVMAVVVGWLFLRIRGVSVWLAQGVALGAAGIAALATGSVHLSPRLGWVLAIVIGATAGVLLYGATVSFVAVAGGHPVFRRHVRALYEQRHGISLPAALVLAALVIAPGEEVFWRGLFQSHIAEGHGWWAGAALTWATYAAANAVGGSLPILAGALVGGAAWGALALVTHGVLAPILCHSVWTGLMLAVPPKAGEAEAEAEAERPGP